MASIASSRPFPREEAVTDFSTEHKLAGWNILIAFLALAVGGLMGVLQVLE